MRRKRVSAIYAKSLLQSSRHVRAVFEELILNRLTPILLQSAISNTPVDMLPLNFAYGLDFVTAFICGLSRSTNFIQQEDRRREWLERYDKSHPHDYMFWLQEQPKLVARLRKLGIHVVPRSYTVADAAFDEWGLQIVDATEFALQAGLNEECAEAGDMPLMYHQLKLTMARELDPDPGVLFYPSPEQRQQIASECLDHVGESKPQPFSNRVKPLNPTAATRDTFGET